LKQEKLEKDHAEREKAKRQEEEELNQWRLRQEAM
jgi:hypothetical protein